MDTSKRSNTSGQEAQQVAKDHKQIDVETPIYKLEKESAAEIKEATGAEALVEIKTSSDKVTVETHMRGDGYEIKRISECGFDGFINLILTSEGTTERILPQIISAQKAFDKLDTALRGLAVEVCEAGPDVS